MLTRIRSWLQKHWWGLVVAYAVAVAGCYAFIWMVIEPIGVPDRFSSLPAVFFQRPTYHILASIFFGAHIVLLMDLVLWRSGWRPMNSQGRVPLYDIGYDVNESKDFYNAIADQYDQRNSPSLLRTHEEVIRLIKKVSVGLDRSNVLDLGGGSGVLVAHHFFDREDMTWVYVDESPLMVAQFQRNLWDTKLKRSVEVVEINQYLARAPDNTFDVIVLSLVLTSMGSNPDFSAMARLLNSKGRLIIADIDASYTATHPLYVVPCGAIRHALRPRPIPLTQLIHETKNAGFKIEHSHPVTDGNIHYAFVAEFSKN